MSFEDCDVVFVMSDFGWFGKECNAVKTASDRHNNDNELKTKRDNTEARQEMRTENGAKKFAARLPDIVGATAASSSTTSTNQSGLARGGRN